MNKEPFALKSLYNKFMEEYTAVVVPADNKKGFVIDYVYYGTWYLWNLPEPVLKAQKTIMLIEGIAGAVAAVTAAAIPSWYNAQSYVAFPAIIAALLYFLEMFGLGQFFFAKYRTTRSNYTAANRKLRIYPILNAIAAFAAMLGCIYYLLAYVYSMTGICLGMLYCLEGLASCLIYRRYVRIPVTSEGNDVLKHVQRATPGD